MERPKLKRTISVSDISALPEMDTAYGAKVLKPEEVKEIQYFNKFSLKREGKRLKFKNF